MRVWWWLLVLTGCVHVAPSSLPPEQWRDEPPAETVSAPEPPRFGPVVGVHLGASLGTTSADFGGRAGVRLRVGRHVDLSLYADVQVAERSLTRFCFEHSCFPRIQPFNVGVATGVARLSLVSDGNIGPLFVPGLTLGLFVGSGVGWVTATEFRPDKHDGVVRAGLHVGMTKLPNGWWFPVFLEGATIIHADGFAQLAFLAGVGL